MSLHIFIVFHKHIIDECYSNIPNEILNKYFTFIAVNEKIEKIYTPNKYNVVNEWELPIYDATLQMRGYNENSALYHVYVNNLHKSCDFIGFFQYDMKFNNNIVEYFLHSHEEKNNSQICAPFALHTFNSCSYDSWCEIPTLEFIINDYETFFQKKMTRTAEYPLYNSYIIPVDIYEKIMKWVIQLYDKMYPWCIQPPNCSHFAHIGGIYERIMAYAIGEEYLSYINLSISHCDYKNICY